MNQKFTDSDIMQMIQSVKAEGYGLTSWEEAFIASVEEQFACTMKLSEKQIEILDRIYTYKVK